MGVVWREGVHFLSKCAYCEETSRAYCLSGRVVTSDLPVVKALLIAKPPHCTVISTSMYSIKPETDPDVFHPNSSLSHRMFPLKKTRACNHPVLKNHLCFCFSFSQIPVAWLSSICWYFSFTLHLSSLDLVFFLMSRKWASLVPSHSWQGGLSKACRAGTCHRANGIEVMDWSVLPDAVVIILRAPDRVLAELHGTARSWVESLWL